MNVGAPFSWLLRDFYVKISTKSERRKTFSTSHLAIGNFADLAKNKQQIVHLQQHLSARKALVYCTIRFVLDRASGFP